MNGQNGINPRQQLVIIKGQDLTGQILCIERDGERWFVTYKSGKSYVTPSPNSLSYEWGGVQ